jgi:hypothetical protein
MTFKPEENVHLAVFNENTSCLDLLAVTNGIDRVLDLEHQSIPSSPLSLGLPMLVQLKSTKLIAIAALLLFPMSSAMGADHLEAPALQGQGSVDINDLFLFQAPGDSSKSVMILTVNPFAGSVSGTTFNSDASYQFQFDNNGDNVSDVTYSTTFSPVAAGSQAYSVNRTDSGGTTTIATGVTGAASTTSNNGLVQAGNFDDPFFFDLNGFNNGFNFTGDDAFAGADVSAIVLELPSADFLAGSSNVGAQAITTIFGERQDRMGRPAIATALLASDRRDAFNAGDPVDDFNNFGSEINAAIAGLSSQANADALTPVLLPDLLTYDASVSSGYLNGRGLSDDVIDASLGLLTEGALASDGVGSNDRQFRSVFPYLASANAVPEPSSAAIVSMLLLSGIMRRSRRS